MTFYHRTHNADAILRDGFRDEEDSYMLDNFTLRACFCRINLLMPTKVPEGIIYWKSHYQTTAAISPTTDWWKEANRTVNGVFPQRSSTGMVRSDS
jgi:hypothetical protein